MKDKFDPFFQQPKFPDLNVLRQELLNDHLIFKQATKPLLEHLNTLARSKTSNILDSSSLGIELRNIESHRAVNINAINRISELALSVEQQTKPWKNMLESLEKTSKVNQFNEQIRLHETYKAFDTWKSSLEQINDSLSQSYRLINHRNSKVISQLVRPLDNYTNFTARTLNKLQNSQAEKLTKALQLSLNLAQVELKLNTDIIADFITSYEEIELDRYSDEDSTNKNSDDAETKDLKEKNNVEEFTFFDTQQEELIDIVEDTEEDDEVDEDFLLNNSDTVKISELVRSVLRKITECNELNWFLGNKETFKPTNRILQVYVDLPYLLPQDKSKFGDFIDSLYWLLYEGAGKDKLRFLKQHGDVLEISECNIIWCVKHLRNTFLRHDPDHGKESDVRKSYKNLSDDFQWLDFDDIHPKSEKHFRDLHYRILEETEIFLKRLIDKMREQN